MKHYYCAFIGNLITLMKILIIILKDSSYFHGILGKEYIQMLFPNLIIFVLTTQLTPLQ